MGHPYDKNGKISEKGNINYKLLNKLNSLEYYKNEGPKSLGIELGDDELAEIFLEVDKDNSGTVDHEEFVKFCVEAMRKAAPGIFFLLSLFTVTAGLTVRKYEPQFFLTIFSIWINGNVHPHSHPFINAPTTKARALFSCIFTFQITKAIYKKIQSQPSSITPSSLYGHCSAQSSSGWPIFFFWRL